MKKKCSVYQYLDSLKVLETGTSEDIANARKAYWKAYKADWRKQQRQKNKEFTIMLNPQEANIVTIAAKKHKRSPSNFIRESCLAYLDNRYITPDVLALGEIKQQLAKNYNLLQNLFEANKVPYQVGTTLLQQMAELEQSVRSRLHSPKTLEQWIVETVRDTPRRKYTLIELLSKL